MPKVDFDRLNYVSNQRAFQQLQLRITRLLDNSGLSYAAKREVLISLLIHEVEKNKEVKS